MDDSQESVQTERFQLRIPTLSIAFRYNTRIREKYKEAFKSDTQID